MSLGFGGRGIDPFGHTSKDLEVRVHPVAIDGSEPDSLREPKDARPTPNFFCTSAKVLACCERAYEQLRELPDHHLVLIGSGPLESRPRSLAARQQSANRIHLIGWQANAVTWMHRAELLLLPAVYEGMPNGIRKIAKVFFQIVHSDLGERFTEN